MYLLQTFRLGSYWGSLKWDLHGLLSCLWTLLLIKLEQNLFQNFAEINFVVYHKFYCRKCRQASILLSALWMRTPHVLGIPPRFFCHLFKGEQFCSFKLSLTQLSKLVSSLKRLLLEEQILSLKSLFDSHSGIDIATGRCWKTLKSLALRF